MQILIQMYFVILFILIFSGRATRWKKFWTSTLNRNNNNNNSGSGGNIGGSGGGSRGQLSSASGSGINLSGAGAVLGTRGGIDYGGGGEQSAGTDSGDSTRYNICVCIIKLLNMCTFIYVRIGVLML